jgi:short-subunit dehydrogenase
MGAFEGSVVLVTGASSGIGAALAREFARRGADLVLAARREDRLAAVAHDVEALGRRCLVVACDVTRDGDCERAVAAAVERFGRLDVAMANAGFGVTGRFDELTVDDYRRQLEVNVFGVLRTMYAALPELRKTRGRIAITGSVSGIVPLPATSAYSTSKFAVRGLAHAVRDELRDAGISLTLLSPGFVASEIRMVDNLGRLRADAREPIPPWLILSADKAARKIVRAVAARRRELVLTFHGKFGAWAYRHFPWLVHAVAARSVGERRSRSFRPGDGPPPDAGSPAG